MVTTSNILPINVVGTIDAATTSGLPTTVFSKAAVKNVVIVNQSPLEVNLLGGIDPVVAATGTFSQSLTVSGIPVVTTDQVGILSVVEDTTPELGGDLNALNNNISSVNIITATSGTFGDGLGTPGNLTVGGTTALNQLTAVTGTFTSGITIGDGTTFIFPDEIRVGQLTATGDVNTSTDYNIGGTQVLSSTTLGSSVVNSSLTNLGTLTGLIMGSSSLLQFVQGAKIKFTGGTGNNFIEGNVSNSGRIGIFTDNLERITTLLGGNVGIGNTLPASKLTVAGDGTFSGDITATSGTFTGDLEVQGTTINLANLPTS